MKRTISGIVVLAVALTLIAIVRAEENPIIGQSAPAFSAPDENGKVVQLSDFAGKIVVLEWMNPDCPFVQRHAKEKTMLSLAEKYKDKGVVWLGINSSRSADKAVDAKWVEENHLSYPILLDATSSIARAYGAKATPHMFVIDKTGKVVYGGAIDNDRDGNKSAADKVNYVAKALDEVLAGRTVSVRQTLAYGCGVKYR
jgi:peroxiredoxin